MRSPLTRVPFIFLALIICTDVSASGTSENHTTSSDSVIARVYTDDTDRIRSLGQNHDLLYYIWREEYAVIRTKRNRMPPDAIIDEQSTSALRSAQEPFRGTGTIPDRPCYRTVEQTYSDLESLANSNPSLAQWNDFGDSWEKTLGLGGYDLSVLVLTNAEVVGTKPVFMVIAASHARELTTSESVTRFGENLVADYGTDPNVTWMLDHFEIHIIPQHNPDGRKMAEAECSGGCFPGWRKNTNQNYCSPGSSNRGADLNRNSSSGFWGGPFSGGSQCGETYRGPSSASEPENTHLEAYIDSVFPDFRSVAPNDFVTPAENDANGVFISVHSAGDIAFYPWEGSNNVPPNLDGLRALAQKTGFASGFAACQNCFLGPASGTNVDYVYETRGIPSLTFETGSSFGETCQNFENIVLPETLAALSATLRHSYRSYQAPQGPDALEISFTSSPDGGTLTATADDTRRAVNGGGEPLQPSQAISKVRYSIDEPPWIAAQTFPMNASDGVFDEPVEEATAGLSNGQISGAARMIFVFAEDADGNQGPPTAIWLPGDGFDFKSSFETP
ncbi:MAG TPA: M14 family zinc carboxypeptidase [Xanthomonadales bacterium]|nr:M14 family zinc carboxypeptidase [Xanthomonadales bacterium]